PSPKTDDPHVHGYALFDEEIAATKAVLGIPEDETFWVPDDVLAWYREVGTRGRDARVAWTSRRDAHPAKQELTACLAGRGLEGWEQKLPRWQPDDKPIATRVASGNCLGAVLEVVPGLVGGGADLTGNTGTQIKGHGTMSAEDPGGRQLFF